MQTRQLVSWAVTSASVVLPLALVLYTLQYQSVPWSLAALAGAAAVAVALAELSTRIAVADPAQQADGREALRTRRTN